MEFILCSLCALTVSPTSLVDAASDAHSVAIVILFLTNSSLLPFLFLFIYQNIIL